MSLNLKKDIMNSVRNSQTDDYIDKYNKLERKYNELEKEMKVTREYIRKQGLHFDLFSYCRKRGIY